MTHCTVFVPGCTILQRGSIRTNAAVAAAFTFDCAEYGFMQHAGSSSQSSAIPAVKRFTLGPFATNCYVLHEPAAATCWVIDCSFDPAPMIEHVRKLGAQPSVLLTHAHCDHIAGLGEFKQAFPSSPIFIHNSEREWLGDPALNLSDLGPAPVVAPAADRELIPGQELNSGTLLWKVLHTPGHSPGSITLYCAKAAVAFAGDALFAGSIGRTDFPGSNHDVLVKAIRTQLYTLPDATRVLPGHGPDTTIGREKQSNPFVRPE